MKLYVLLVNWQEGFTEYGEEDDNVYLGVFKTLTEAKKAMQKETAGVLASDDGFVTKYDGGIDGWKGEFLGTGAIYVRHIKDDFSPEQYIYWIKEETI